jgi:Single-strand binding protein family
MGDANLFIGIVKILETPKQKTFTSGISNTKFRVQFPQFRNTTIIYLTFWGNLANDVAKFYKINDYILVEGYISLRDKNNSTKIISKSKKVDISVLKIYPVVLRH